MIIHATTREHQTWRRRLACLAVAGMWLWSAPGSAQEDAFSLDAEEDTAPADPATVRDLIEITSEVEVGAGSISDDSFRFGKYSGLERQGGFAVLGVDLRGRGAYDGPNARYWSLTGSDLGLTSRSLGLEHGRQGRYKIVVTYDQLPTFRSDSAQTVFDGVGGTSLTLPPGWVAATTTAGMTQLIPSLKDVNIDHERRRLGVGIDTTFFDAWTLTTRVTREAKDGLKTVGAVIGNSGGNPRSVLIPEPIDYVTQQVDVALSYGDHVKQIQLGYSLSLFNDGNDSLKWENPFSAITGWDASAGYSTGEGQLHLPPDNQFHQLTASGGYNWSDRTRVTVDLARGRMTQDQAFLPYTINPTLAASITQPLPRSSLDGLIETTLLTLRIASRPTSSLYWNAAYRYDDRDNKTPRDEYVYIGGDSQTQSTGATSSFRRFNEPYSFSERQIKLDVGYQPFRRTDLTAGAEQKETTRTFSEREDATEMTYKVGLDTHPAEWVGAGVRVSRADRHGTTYRGEEPFLSSYDPGYTATVAGGWENHPDLRKYFQADRLRNTLAFLVSLTPGERWTLGANSTYRKDDYETSDLGLTKSTINTYTADTSYVPFETVTTYAFYTLEFLKSDQDGRQFSGGAVKLAQAADPTRDWFADHRDRVDTLGGGVTKALLKNTLDLGADYVYAKSKSQVDVTVGSALTAAPLPNTVTRLNSISLYGKYKLTNALSLKVRYRFEKFRSTDWAVDDVAPNTLANVITLGEESPDYRIQVVTVSLAYRF